MDNRLATVHLTNHHINAIGHRHRKSKSVKDRVCYSLWHLAEDQERKIALEFHQYDQANIPEEKWLYLAHAYGRLNDNHCSLAQEIKQLIQNAFNVKEIPLSYKKLHHYRWGHVYETIEYLPGIIVEQFSTIIKDSFANNQSARLKR